MCASLSLLMSLVTLALVLPRVVADTNGSSERSSDVARSIWLVEGLNVVRYAENLEYFVVVLAVV